MRFVRGLVGLALRVASVAAALWGVLQLSDGHPIMGVVAFLSAIVLIIAGTELRSRHARRADLTDAIYMAGDDMFGYKSHVNRRHRN